MEKRIIELTKVNEIGSCLLCCERDATVEVKINRLKYNDGVVAFNVCDQCLAKMQQEIHKICE